MSKESEYFWIFESIQNSKKQIINNSNHNSTKIIDGVKKELMNSNLLDKVSFETELKMKRIIRMY